MMCFGLKDRSRMKTNHSVVIVLLDDTQLVHDLHASSTGQDLLDVVIKHLNLLETSYFGLRYLASSSSSADSALRAANSNTGSQKSATAAAHTMGRHQQVVVASEPVWLDMNKSAIKQLKDVYPMTVYFGVKYYASDPCKLAEEITRYQFFLQCKQDILHGRLPVSLELAVELFALAVQSELGDYDPQRHQEGYVSEFQFLANGQSVELERRVAQFHRSLSGQVPATAEMNFLERVKWLDLYGADLHPIQYDETSAQEYTLGLNPSGVLVLRNKLKVAHYHWARIVKTKCQGRCFLMDVIDNNNNNNSGNNQGRQAGGGSDRNRFGFRLADKAASRRLRWAIEEHKSFYHLIHNSATLNQLAQRQRNQQQQQHMKLSQRFRHSIRSAINVGGQFGTIQHQHQMAAAAAAAANAAYQQQQQKLRSSIKANGGNQQQHQAMMQHQQQQYAPLDARPPPQVVRMPSRRYSNRSLTRNATAGGYHLPVSSAANGNGLPLHHIPGSGAHTMVESQRQQAIMMMNQFNQMNCLAGKSQTLKPMPTSGGGRLDSKEAKKNPYYQMMMMMAANQQQLPEVAVLPPGRHIVQPSIYRASSALNGINQLGGGSAASGKQQQQQQQMEAAANGQQRGGLMMQLFNTRPQYSGYHGAGHESPRSTKSAIAPSSALKLASKKLAKHQQQLLYANQPADVLPLLAYETSSIAGHNQYSAAAAANGGHHHYYGPSQPVAYNASNSANPSPRSVRSARMAGRHKSKSTNENLHLLHNSSSGGGKYLHHPSQSQVAPIIIDSANHQQQQQQGSNNKMLLATTQQLIQQQQQQQQQQQHHHHNLPPPAYHHSSGAAAAPPLRQRQPAGLHLYGTDDDESEMMSKSMWKSRSATMGAGGKKHATFALDTDRSAAAKLLNTNGLGLQEKGRAAVQRGASDEDDYCCSKSDCSSIDDGEGNSNDGYKAAGHPQTRRRRSSATASINQDYNGLLPPARLRKAAAAQIPIDQQRDWNAIRKRHNDYSSGKGFLVNGGGGGGGVSPIEGAGAGADAASRSAAANRRQAIYEPQEDPNNNNSNHCSQLVKNIANKQATPILLSMNYATNESNDANNKAVQLLNLQRQQLNSQSSSDNGTKSCSSAADSAPSSVASSPQAPAAGGCQPQQQQQPASNKTATAADSTASSSTTSGYYAGSNSTGSASVDSDSQANDHHHHLHQQTTGAPATRHHQQQARGKHSHAAAAYGNNWQEEGSRAKIALGSHTAARMSAASGQRTNFKGADGRQQGRATQSQKQQQQFYLNDDETEQQLEDGRRRHLSSLESGGQQWSPLNQIQQHPPSSLKYVSFDV